MKWKKKKSTKCIYIIETECLNKTNSQINEKHNKIRKMIKMQLSHEQLLNFQSPFIEMNLLIIKRINKIMVVISLWLLFQTHYAVITSLPHLNSTLYSAELIRRIYMKAFFISLFQTQKVNCNYSNTNGKRDSLPMQCHITK